MAEPSANRALSAYTFEADVGVNFGLERMNNAQIRGPRDNPEVFVWTTPPKIGKNTTLTKIKGDAFGEVTSVLIEDWTERRDRLEKKLKIERTDKPGVCKQTGPYWSDYSDEAPAGTRQAFVSCDFLEKMTPVYIATFAEERVRLALNGEETSKSNKLNGIYRQQNNRTLSVNATVLADSAIREACTKKTPREMYFSLSDGPEKDMAIALMSERYDVDRGLEAFNFMEEVCTRRNQRLGAKVQSTQGLPSSAAGR